jgi:hypothetical protein
MADKSKNPLPAIVNAVADLAGDTAQIISHRFTTWASIAFSGERHELTLQFNGDDGVEAGENFVAFLPEWTPDNTKPFLADAAVISIDHRTSPPMLTVRCELLVLD